MEALRTPFSSERSSVEVLLIIFVFLGSSHFTHDLSRAQQRCSPAAKAEKPSPQLGNLFKLNIGSKPMQPLAGANTTTVDDELSSSFSNGEEEDDIPFAVPEEPSHLPDGAAGPDSSTEESRIEKNTSNGTFVGFKVFSELYQRTVRALKSYV